MSSDQLGDNLADTATAHESPDTEVLDIDSEAPEEDRPTADQHLRYYGVDFDVEGIVRRFDRKDLIVPSFDPAPASDSVYEGFQRRFVWPKKQMDRFIESLLLGYPVPGIFLVEEANRRFLILDGQQRIRTLHSFYQGEYLATGEKPKIFALDNVAKEFRGLTYKTLPEPDRRLLDSTLLQATVVVPRESDLEPVYRVFERINSSGIKLTAQEIRVALYSGELIHLIRSLNENSDWRQMFGLPHSRLKDHELILRYLALLENAEVVAEFGWDSAIARRSAADETLIYRPAMTSFLNRYLDRHRNMQGLNADKLTRNFAQVVRILNGAKGKSALRLGSSQVNAAQSDSFMVGLGLAIEKGANVTEESARRSIEALTLNTEYTGVLADSTSHSENVQKRLKMAYEQFSSDAI